ESGDPARGDYGRLEARTSQRLPDRFGQGDVAREGSPFVDADRRHAFLTARSGIGIGGLAHLGLLGVLELPALGDTEKIETSLGKAKGEPSCILHPAPPLDHFVPEETAADHEIIANALADRGV